MRALERAKTPDTLRRVTTNEGPLFDDLNQREEIDRALRPRRLKEFTGQGRVRQNLSVSIAAAKKRGEPLEHLLLSGLPGLGKTSLSHIIAAEMDVDVRVTSGPALERTGDLVGLLTSLRQGDILFVDEIHRLPRVVEEFLYSAMEDFRLDVMIDSGPAARSIPMTLEKFTLVGATTREGLLTAPFRARFGLIEKLELYPASDLMVILERSANLLELKVDAKALSLIAARSRGTPRVANRLLRRVRDLAQVLEAPSVSTTIAEQTLANLGIDSAGLETTDRKILRCLVRAGGVPVGLKTISAAVGEEEDTIESVYEPYLLSLGFVVKTPRGRLITERGQAHLEEEEGSGNDGEDGSKRQGELFP